ncbi:MAG TPA: transporter [Chitinophagaceae bacterium]|nr:transporter [Chitinophagaceae bacterium]
MKKFLFPVFIFQILSITSSACDICGCGVSNYNPYMFPHLAGTFIGLGYEHRHFHTHFLDQGEEISNDESYNSIMLAAQFSPLKRLRILALVPFQLNNQAGPEGNKSLSQFGDISLLFNYTILDQKSKNKRLRQSLLLGAGCKIPTGAFAFDENSESGVGNSNFQPGTGSTDLLLNSYYSIRYGNLAFSTALHYRINSENEDGYRFGNRLQSISQLKMIVEIGDVSFIPNLGIMMETAGQDREFGTKIIENRTGGNITNAICGLDINTRNLAIGFNYATVIAQNLAAGQIVEQPGFSIRMGYTF